MQQVTIHACQACTISTHSCMLGWLSGSALCRTCCRSASEAIRQYGLRADVFTYSISDVVGLDPWTSPVDPGIIDATAANQHAYILRMTQSVFSSANVPMVAIQERGNAVASIINVAERENCDLIVLGNRGLNGLQALMFGSVSAGVLHHAHCSVLVLHGDGMPAHVNWFERILLASDLSSSASKATNIAVALADRFRSELTVINVQEPFDILAESVDPYTEMTPDQLARQALAKLEQNMSTAVQNYRADHSYTDSSQSEMETIGAPSEIRYNLRQEQGHTAATIIQVADEIDS